MTDLLGRPQRYSETRQHVNWHASAALKVLKQLAGAIKRHEACGVYDLWRRTDQLYPQVSQMVLGVEISFRAVREDVRATQHRVITPNRLLGRADVVNRKGYEETDEYTAPTVTAYLALSHIQVALDPRRSFTDEEVRTAMLRQGGVCGVPTCRAPFQPLNPPQGDHAMPHSLGGRTSADNCIAMCTRCNSQKGDLTLQEFVAKHAMNNARGRRHLVESR